MKKEEILKIFLIIGFLLILIALFLWREFSFVLAGGGIIIIGVGIMLYMHKKE
jgi:hypothetical protein